MIGEAVKRAVGDAMRQVRSAFRGVGAVIQLARDIQLVDGEGVAGEQLKALELFQQFGFTSGLPAGTQLIVLPLGGRTSHAVIVATENTAYRLAVEAGEVRLYNQWGDYFHLGKEGKAKIHVAAELEIDTPLVRFTGAVEVAQTVTSVGDQVAGGVSQISHRHMEQGDGLPTSPPL